MTLVTSGRLQQPMQPMSFSFLVLCREAIVFSVCFYFNTVIMRFLQFYCIHVGMCCPPLPHTLCSQ